MRLLIGLPGCSVGWQRLVSGVPGALSMEHVYGAGIPGSGREPQSRTRAPTVPWEAARKLGRNCCAPWHQLVVVWFLLTSGRRKGLLLTSLVMVFVDVG